MIGNLKQKQTIYDDLLTGWSSSKNPKHARTAPHSRHSCFVCGQEFSGLTALKTHKLLHTGEKPFACDMCPKRFRQLVHLKTHREGVHAPKEKCFTCGSAFSTLDELKSHRTEVHGIHI